MVLKSSIRTSASPRRQQSHWGLRMTQDAYFSLLTHTKQLFIGDIFVILLQELEVVFGHTDGCTEGAEGQTDVEVEIVYLDFIKLYIL